MNKKILFIGANGYMGHGMSLNLLKQNNLYVIANKQRNNIENLIKEGAKEINSYQEIKNLDLDCLMLCVTNTPIAIEIANNVSSLLKSSTLVIDLTTHNKNGTTKMKDIFDKYKISFVVSPVMGSKNESLKGILGSIWGGDQSKFEESKLYLNTFCENIFNFGSVEKACAAKLLSNFLSLLTTTTVIEYFKEFIIGKNVEEIEKDIASIWEKITNHSQLRWVGPQKGVTHLAAAAFFNAIWDLISKFHKKPLWRYIIELETIDLLDNNKEKEWLHYLKTIEFNSQSSVYLQKIGYVASENLNIRIQEKNICNISLEELTEKFNNSISGRF